MSRPIPMIDDVSLDAVTSAHHGARQRVASLPVAGLAGDVQQILGRASHEITLRGVLVGDGAKDALAGLQDKVTSGAEATFTADITTALEMQHVVIVEASFEESAGLPDHYQYLLVLRESPPLPEPASLDPFGGLDGFDLGFDTDILGDIASLADDIQNAAEQALDAVKDLQSLASLGDLALGNPLEPIQDEAGKLKDLGSSAANAAKALGSLLGGSG